MCRSSPTVCEFPERLKACLEVGAQLARVEPAVLGSERVASLWGEDATGEQAAVGRLRAIVPLDDPGAMAFFGDQFADGLKEVHVGSQGRMHGLEGQERRPRAIAIIAVKTARILIVDDQETNVRLLESLLRRWGYASLKGLTDPREVPFAYNEFQPDLILLDLHMPHQDGFAVMEGLKPLIPAGSYFPILVLTADVTTEVKQRALASGAKDFLTKPFDQTEVLLRIQNLLETRCLHLELQGQNQTLEEKVRQRTRELEEAHIAALERLALAAEYRDDETGEHTKRVGVGAALLARGLGVPQDQIVLIRRAAPLHDVGKIAIPDHILLKPGPLTPEEFAVMKTHTTIGAKLLSGGQDPLLRMAEQIALSHHERWDGTGYPQGLTGEAIPVASRIVAVVDVFDALTNSRPYKTNQTTVQALTELERCAGTQFDPWCVAAFLSLESDPVARSVLRLPRRSEARNRT